ncbi:energy transducer TonB [Ferruginibacter yonginensis]|uniref:Energy transducer TonB n=1 Tax=Ferruginibacter yonginensis TaxID=1310416 RepID=A0ABV8QQ02_9BACT
MTTTAIAQNKTPSLVYDSPSKSMDYENINNDIQVHLPVVKTNASFCGGKTAWHQFISSQFNNKVIVTNKLPSGKYAVIIYFVIDRNGNISEVKSGFKQGQGLGEELERCIKKSPQWQPAETASGKKVAQSYNTMVTVVVDNYNVQLVFPK